MFISPPPIWSETWGGPKSEQTCCRWPSGCFFKKTVENDGFVARFRCIKRFFVFFKMFEKKGSDPLKKSVVKAGLLSADFLKTKVFGSFLGFFSKKQASLYRHFTFRHIGNLCWRPQGQAFYLISANKIILLEFLVYQQSISSRFYLKFGLQHKSSMRQNWSTDRQKLLFWMKT